jgi:UDP-2-acetamido-2,6-beta-L-arabino-hexul-4-ose reductase
VETLTILVIGNGLIARAFAHYSTNPDVTILASGVSNSGCGVSKDFAREQRLITRTIKSAKGSLLVYFSSASTDSTPYIRHKRNMESLVASHGNHLIIRLPQVVGLGGNPNNLFNCFRSKLSAGEDLTILSNAYRSLVDIDDVVRIADKLIDGKRLGTYSLNHIERIRVADIANLMASAMGVKPNISIVKGFSIHCGCNHSAIADIVGKSTENYTQNLLNKYL